MSGNLGHEVGRKGAVSTILVYLSHFECAHLDLVTRTHRDADVAEAACFMFSAVARDSTPEIRAQVQITASIYSTELGVFVHLFD